MSNTAVGAIYKKIIDAVVEASKTDFEENGVANDVLLALQEDWQNRLSSTQRASFPWDPQPEPHAAPAPVKAEPISNASPVPSPVTSQPNPTGVQIKQEPAYEANFLNLPQTPPYTSGLNQPQYAHQRAAHLLQKQFGNQATGSIGAIQAAQMGLPGAQQRPQNSMQRPQAKQENPYIKQENGQENLSLAQTDGAADGPADSSTTAGPSTVGSISEQVADMAQRLEGGGLLVPLDERRKLSKKSAKAQRHQGGHGLPGMPMKAEAGPSTFAAGYDGTDDADGIADDDVINSDLDDSDDDELEGTIETDFKGDVILCLYDKVQRVKNKWKCTLKDGVVTVDGKDYVFHKAQGEFEW